VHQFERCIFERIEKYNLSFNVLDNPEKEVIPFVLPAVCSMFIEKIFNDLDWTEFFLVAFLAIIGKQGKEYPGFLNAMKGEGSKKTVVELEFDTDFIPELLQAPVGRMIHHLLFRVF
jgi:hypothetical protein